MDIVKQVKEALVQQNHREKESQLEQLSDISSIIMILAKKMQQKEYNS